MTPVGSVSARGYNAHLIGLTDVRVADDCILGAEGKGFDFATEWLYASRVMMAAHCTGRARLVLELAADWARTRRQFGRPIGEFQGVSFKLADMETEIRAAWLLTMHAAWKLDQGTLEPLDASVAKLYASEMVGRVTDHGVQIFGGMGVSTELPIERYWRDARVERILGGHLRDPPRPDRARDSARVSAAPQNVRRLLRPQSVAFVGGSLAPAAMAVCESLGFSGPIYAVHPTRPEVDGWPAYPSVDALPEVPDAVFVAVNAAASVEIVRQLSDLGAGGAVLYAAGFSEAGTAAGTALEQELREAAGDLAVLGPNCYGIVDLVGGVSLWPVPFPQVRRERGVAMILQSGNLGINVTIEPALASACVRGECRKSGGPRDRRARRCLSRHGRGDRDRHLPRGPSRRPALRGGRDPSSSSAACRSPSARPAGRSSDGSSRTPIPPPSQGPTASTGPCSSATGSPPATRCRSCSRP